MSDFSLALQGPMAKINAADWDRLAGCNQGSGNPFVSHAFLSALEDSGCVAPDTSWQPQHALLYDDQERLVGACPLYAKYHSYGEYIFDHGWADALERAGGHYYPKLLSAVPFTPVTGPRLLCEAPEAQAALLQGLRQICERAELSSLHVNFVPAGEAALAETSDFLLRKGLQYHWHNPGYASFDAFLADLTSRKRKAIVKERQAVADSGLTLKRLSGDDIKPQHWDAFFAFYMDTSDRKWGQAYLNRAFFDLLHQRLRDQVVLVLAFDGAEIVAGALNLASATHLFGRNWGCLERAKFLHFEACYYQAIEHAIERGLTTVEAGAQGHHKLQRGYLPSETYSLHWMSHPQFHAAIDRYLVDERQGIEAEIAALMDSSPFKARTGSAVAQD